MRPSLAVVIVTVGCSGAHHDTPPPPTPTAAAPCPREPPTFQQDRYRDVKTSFMHVLKADVKVPMIPFPAKEVHDRCNEMDELVRPFCFEGAALKYGLAVAKAVAGGSDAGISDTEQGFAAADERWNPIECRGFGNGLAKLDFEHQATVFAKISPRCAQHAADGMGAAWGWDGSDPLAPCESFDAPACQSALAQLYGAVETKCAARPPYAAYCMYGFGRMIGNFFAGRFEDALRTCRGTYKAACTSGVGFVAVYLYPDKIERALQASTSLPAADQGGYFEGIANGLMWRKKSDPARLDTGLGRLSPPARGLANDILAAAASCGLTDFHSGTSCRWPTAPQSCIP